MTPTFKYNPIPNITSYLGDATAHMAENSSKHEHAQLRDFLSGLLKDIIGHNLEHDDALKNSDIEYRTTDILIHGKGKTYKLDISVNLEGDINYVELTTPDNEIISANLSFASLSLKQLIVLSLADSLMRTILNFPFSDEVRQEQSTIGDEDERHENICRRLKAIGYDPDTFAYDITVDDITEISRKYFMNEDTWITLDDFKYLVDAFSDMSTDEHGEPCGFAPTMQQYDPETKRHSFLFSVRQDTLVVEIIDEKLDAVVYYTDEVEHHISDGPEASDFDKIFLDLGHTCMIAYGYYLTLHEEDNS